MTEEQKFNVKEKTPPRSGLYKQAMAAVTMHILGLGLRTALTPADQQVRWHKPTRSRIKTSGEKRKFHRQKKSSGK